MHELTDREVPLAADLATLRAQVADVRITLASVQEELRASEQLLSSSKAAQMLAANEQLVLSMMRAHADQEVAAQEMANAARLAATDYLTDLPNRVLLRDRFAHAIAAANRRSARLALLFVDLDDFKKINDAFGHAVGDQVLKHVAVCLASSVRGSDTVSRIGGDEFVILLSDVLHDADVVQVAEKIAAALAVPTIVDERRVQVTASIGIGMFPEDGDTLATLIDRADAAMYRAKRNGVGRYGFHRARVSMSDHAPRPPEAPPA